MMREIRTTCLVAAAGISLSGCIGLGEKPPENLLTLTATSQPAADVVRSAEAGRSLIVLPPSVPRMLDNDRLAVITSATGVAYLEDARWSDQPARLFADVLADTIAARSNRLVIDRRQYALSPGERLTGRLAMFGLDATRGEAVIVYDAALAPGEGKPVSTRRFEARRAITSEKPGAVAAALNQSANEIAVAVADWIGQ